MLISRQLQTWPLFSSTFFRGLYLYDRKRLDYSCAAAGRAFIFLFDPLVILRQRPNLVEGFVALLTMKFVRRHVFPSCSSPFDPDAINHPLDPEHVPSVAFGHLFHGLIGNQPIERDDPVLACDPDFGRIDKWIFFQCEPDSIGQLIVAAALLLTHSQHCAFPVPTRRARLPSVCALGSALHR